MQKKYNFYRPYFDLDFKYFYQKYQSFIVSVLIIFTLLFLAMPPRQWHSNEEQYLGYAWRLSSPENIIQISALKDEANHRFLFEYLANLSIYLIGFEWTHALGRILVALLYAISLVTFFKSCKFSLVTSCTILLTFICLDETIIGEEWLFKSFEPKTLAYSFVFLALSRVILGKFKSTYLYLVPATYFHFLIGGFWFLVVAIVQGYWSQNFKRTFRKSIIYLLLCLPLLLIIFSSQLQSQTVADTTPSANWIYSYFRAPHHISPFASANSFSLWWYKGICLLIGLTVASLILYFSEKNDKTKKLVLPVLTLNIYLILCLVVAYFDQEGVLGKFYIFRPSSIILLLNLCLFAYYLKKFTNTYFTKFSLISLVLISSLSLPTLAGHQMIYKQVEDIVVNHQPFWKIAFTYKDFFPSFKDLFQISTDQTASGLDKLIQASQKDNIFLIDPKLDYSYLSFERKYDRPTLISYKFVPTTTQGILRWYKLLNQREQLFEKGCPALILNEYKIHYIIALFNNQAVNNCGKEIYRNERIKIIHHS